MLPAALQLGNDACAVSERRRRLHPSVAQPGGPRRTGERGQVGCHPGTGREQPDLVGGQGGAGQ
jgi:hypothetical protein